MGSLQAQPEAVLDVQLSQVAASPEQQAAWLDGILASPARAIIGAWGNEDVRFRLKAMPLDLVLSAVGRAARPADADAAAEILLYREWIEANPASLLVGIAWFNLGVVLVRDGHPANAMIAYRNALVLRPDLHAAAVNLGLLLEAGGETDEALTTWGGAIQPDDVRVALGIQRGRLLERLGRFDEAERALYQVLLTDPAQPDVIHHWVHLRQKSCRWPATPDDVPGLSAQQLLHGSGPLGILALTDDIGLQRESAASWIIRKTEPPTQRLAPPTPYDHERIRIGYMSSDFCSHAMSYLITELFERHDRARFEIFGYCASQDDGTQLRQRVLAAFDHHRIIRTLSDEQVAQVIRADEIDVLVDLNGLTEGSRLAALRWRPAPIQASYLGFIGPLPMPELDYLFCDTTVVPPEYECAYQPKPLAIASIYQVNDSKRTIGRPLTRAEVGLPEDRFVFCCMSRHYKITETVFAGWMSVLRQVDGSVLWLAADNRFSEANLKDAARRAGIAEERLIISERADPDLYLSRLALADLFLDTFPYNAGTVASDAMRMQLPILTLCGAAFASRMATSLLRMIGATGGIATSIPQYVETAVRLARDPEAYRSYKALFTTAAWQGTIGNIARFTTEYEASILRIVAAAKDAGRPTPAEVPAADDHGWAEGFRQAVQHHQAGRRDHADRLYRIALQSPLAPPAAHFNFGVLCMERERPSEAAEAFRRALALQPDMLDAIINLGTTVLGAGRPDEAVAQYQRAIALSPDSAMAFGNLGKVLQDLGRVEEAFAAYYKAHALRPESVEVLINLGAALLDQHQWDEAVRFTRDAIALRPTSAMAHANLAVGLLGLGQHEAALAACRQAMALDPQGAAIACTLGGTMLELGEATDAVALCRKAIALDPASASAYFNYSHACKALNQLEAAEEAAEAAIAHNPGSAVYHFHLAHTLLLQGDMERGWEEYEQRWKLADFAELPGRRERFPQPLWTGEDISNKTILIYTEQGLGDIIQFARYLPLVVARAGRVLLAASAATRRLLSSIAGLTLIDPAKMAQQSFDVHSALLSLPHAFGTRIDTIPANIPYLQVDPLEAARWAARIDGKGPRVGIVWAGNPATKRDRFRSPRLHSVAPLFSVPGITFVSLQMGAGRQDLAETPLPENVIDLGGEIADLADTAAIMAGLDLMISSCTAPLHLAGALGRPTWATIPFAPHFPWLLNRSDSPWYPSMRLYRQSQPGTDWSSVVDQIARDLGAFQGSRKAALF
jgi:predicted O-linked N-acetylglucosamine transferase (SPINDLY family)